MEEGKSDLATSRAGAGMKAGGDISRITRSLSLSFTWLSPIEDLVATLDKARS